MAMTKKEKALLESLENELRLAKAFRFTDKVNPDVLAPLPGESFGKLVTGYLIVGEQGDNPRVEVACSSSIHHSAGRNDRTTTQGPRNLFSTRLLALKAMRNIVEIRFASMLAEIDRKIELEAGDE